MVTPWGQILVGQFYAFNDTYIYIYWHHLLWAKNVCWKDTLQIWGALPTQFIYHSIHLLLLLIFCGTWNADVFSFTYVNRWHHYFVYVSLFYNQRRIKIFEFPYQCPYWHASFTLIGSYVDIHDTFTNMHASAKKFRVLVTS